MANRSQKAAMKKRADAEKAERAAERVKKEKALEREVEKAAKAIDAQVAKEAKAAKAVKAKAAKQDKPKPTKPTRGAKPKKGKATPAPTLEFEEVHPQESVPAKPGFLTRLRAAREDRAHQRQAEAEHRAEERAAAEQRTREGDAVRLAAEAKQRHADEARARKEETAAEKEAAKEARRLQRQAERAAIEEREARAAAEAEAEDARKAAARAAKRQAKKEAAEAELEPELEFEEGSERVDPSRALVPEGQSATPVDEQAEKVAAELSRRRSKPVVVVGEDLPIPKFPKAARHTDEEATGLVTGEPIVDEKYRPEAPSPPPPSGLSIPEMFLLLANEGGWDERAEKTKEGYLGGALAGALMLELLQRGRILVQRDRFTIVGEPTGDDATAAIVAKLRRAQERKSDLTSLRQMTLLGKWNRELLEPFKDRLAGRGLVEHGHRMHLGLLYRSHVNLLDEDAQERLRNKLRRAIAGGGTPEASSILLLGLLDACGLLGSIVPDGAMDYNRKRLNGLLGGRDIMGYKVDAQLKGTQEIAVRTILQNVRSMTFGR